MSAGRLGISESLNRRLLGGVSGCYFEGIRNNELSQLAGLSGLAGEFGNSVLANNFRQYRIEAKPPTKSVREELQAEVNDWLKDTL